jgi:hypothetical protein
MSERNFQTFRRGMRRTTCEMCGHEEDCVLRLIGDRYLWTCADGCDEVWQFPVVQGVL